MRRRNTYSGYRITRVDLLLKEGTKDIYPRLHYSTCNGYSFYTFLGKRSETYRGYRRLTDPEGFKEVVLERSKQLGEYAVNLEIGGLNFAKPDVQDYGTHVNYANISCNFVASPEEYTLHLEYAKRIIQRQIQVESTPDSRIKPEPLKVILGTRYEASFALSTSRVTVRKILCFGDEVTIYDQNWGETLEHVQRGLEDFKQKVAQLQEEHAVEIMTEML